MHGHGCAGAARRRPGVHSWHAHSTIGCVIWCIACGSPLLHICPHFFIERCSPFPVPIAVHFANMCVRLNGCLHDGCGETNA
eukprot:9341577-Prorocentrum_lima.AAC.1